MKRNMYLDNLSYESKVYGEDLTVGQTTLCNVYERTMSKQMKLSVEFEDIIMDDLYIMHSDEDLKSLFEALEDAEINSFTISSNSTALLKVIHFALGRGYKVEPTEIIVNKSFVDNGYDKVKALRVLK